MAHYEEQNKWPPHDTLSHLAVHTPIQVNPRCGDNGAQGMFHPLQSGAWRLPTAFPPTFTGGQAPYYRPYGASHPQQATALQFLQEEANKKVVDWNNGNNNKALGEQIWQAEEQKAAEWQQQQHQQHTQQQTEQETSEANGTSIHLNESNTSLNGIQNGTAAVISPPLPPNRDELIAPKAIHADCETINRLINGPMPIILENKNDNGQSYESSRHSMTDSDDLEEQRLDVEVSSSSDESPKRATSPQAQPDQPQNTVMDTTEAVSPVKDEVDIAEINPLLNIKTEIITSLEQPKQQTEDQEHENHKDDDASSLLLNFSQQGFLSTTSTSAVESDLLLNKESVILPTFSHPTSVSPTPATTASNGLSPDQGATFCRPPGLGPASLPPSSMNNGQQPLVCPICGFSCNSKFHYNSHMNTHGDHQCSMCDYTSRTEGRLKKHMRESHTVEEQLAAGLEVQMDQSGRVQTPPASTSAMNTSPEVSGLSTTMASLVDAANSVVNSQAQVQLTPTSLATALGMDSFLGQLTSTPNLPSALEQIRAFTEKNNMMPDPNVNLASALGVMSQTMLGSPDKGDNKSNSEPRRNSNGKQKTYKCKQCPHISMSKDEQWAHARTHIPLDKQMSCPKCNFVTEYKHHLEYHIRNHIGSKPFQCKKCSYTCVNKSMLNSHMKSHTNVYQFRCMDCTYATKYCHSLKLHLKKYGHRRVPDGTPMDDSPTQMVHPESAFQRISESVGMCLADNKSFAPPTTLAQTLGLPNFVNPSPFNYSQMLLRQNSLDQLSGLIQMPQPQLTCAVCDYQTGSKDELIRHNMSHLIGAQQPNNALLSNSSLFGSLPLTGQFTPDNSSHEGIDVVKTEDDEHEMTPDHDMPESSGSSASPSSKSSGDEGIPSRKRKAFKLEQISQRLQGKSPSVSDESSTEQHNDDENLVGEPSSSPSETHGDSMQNTPTIAQPIAQMPQPDTMSIFQQACLAHLNAMQMKQHDSDLWRFSCPHCRVAFQDQALYHIHMGYHGYEHMFKCNRCGHRAQDALNFNLHLLQASHE